MHVERPRWPLIGRDDELASARRHLAQREAGGLIVAGEPGVGKTRLASEIAASASDRDVRWVRATRSAASIPLGAFAALLPAPDGATGLAELLARARHAPRTSHDGRPIVLCIDDAHLLDDVSATLAHQLVAAGDALVVATIRDGERAPDAVHALWKDELCALIRLHPLERGALQRL